MGCSLELSLLPDGFRLSLHGRQILRHMVDRPAVAVGSGRGRMEMRHGNFRIRDGARRRIFCRKAKLIEGGVIFPDLARLRFEGVGERSGGLRIELTPLREGLNRCWLALEVDPNERIWGGGVQYSHGELRGRLLPIWVREQGIGRGHDPITLYAQAHSGSGGKWHTTYFPQPTLVSSAGWYCLSECDAYSEIDLRGRERIWLHEWRLPASIEVGVCDSTQEAVSRLSARLGRQPPLPDWTWDGLWLGVQGGSVEIERKLARAIEGGVKVGALWVQDWVGKRETAFGRQLMWNWSWDRSAYPDLPGAIAGLLSRGIRFLGYINPFLAVEGALYREAHRQGYCVKDGRGDDRLIVVTTFPAALLDLTNPEARRWIKGIITETMIGIGMGGWMADYGEYLPMDVQLFDGTPPELFHNRYPVEWARVNHEALREADALERAVFFMRAGFTGSSRSVPAFWAGDQLTNWSRHDGLPSAVAAQIAAGLSGIGVMHSDIGGYTSLAWVRRRKELFLRWAEQAAFSPIMRSHEGNRPDDCWQFDSDRETLAHLARMSAIFVGLKEYHRRLQADYAASGLPAIRHLALHYPEPHLLREQGSYLYGSDLLVAPVLRPRRRDWRVRLPDDDWVHLWSGKHYGAGEHRIEAPLGYPPIFYVASSEWRDLFLRLCRIATG